MHFEGQSLGIAAVAGLDAAASAQESVVFTYSFVETLVGTSTPVTGPNGFIEPGESARIFLTTRVVPDIGATVSYPPPPPPGSGTIAGLGYFLVDLNGTGGTLGTFTLLSRASGWGIGPGGSLNPT